MGSNLFMQKAIEQAKFALKEDEVPVGAVVVSEDQILYEFTISDPVNYTEIWGGQLPFNRFDDQVLEYSCHEGNYGLVGILAGARADDAAAQAGGR